MNNANLIQRICNDFYNEAIYHTTTTNWIWGLGEISDNYDVSKEWLKEHHSDFVDVLYANENVLDVQPFFPEEPCLDIIVAGEAVCAVCSSRGADCHIDCEVVA